MVFARCSKWCAAMLACAGLALLASAPLQAQDTQFLLGSMKHMPVNGVGGLKYGKIKGYGVYLIAGEQGSRPACIILAPTATGKSKMEPGKLQEDGKRFAAAYKLEGYKTCVAEDGSAVFFFRPERNRRWRYKGEQALYALADNKSLAATINWLNATVGGEPQKLAGNSIIWRRKTKVGQSERELEVELNLLRGVPCYVEIKLRVPLSSAAEAISENLRLRLGEIKGTAAYNMQRKIGSRPVGVMAGAYKKEGDTREVSITLIRLQKGKDLYRLADAGTLQRFKGDRGRDATLPEVKICRWADEMQLPASSTEGSGHDGTNGRETLLGSSQLPGGGNAEPEPETEPETEAQAQQADTPPSATEADKENAAAELPPSGKELSPAEAREAYRQRLKSL